MKFLRTGSVLLCAALAASACGGSGDQSATPQDPGASATTTTVVTTEQSQADGNDADEPDVATSAETTTTTEPSTTSEFTTTTALPEDSVGVVEEVDRKVSVSGVVVADSDGSLLATVLDPDGAGCEASPISYFATVSADGIIRPSSATDETFQYAAISMPSPNGRQLLEVSSCEGFLGSVSLYDIDSSLQLTNPVEVDIRGAIAGDAGWNPDGFITMVLSNQPGFLTEPDIDTEPVIEEFLVNPRSGESTKSGTLSELNYGAVRLPAGGQIFNLFDETGQFVVVTARNGEELRRFEAGGFALSPDTNFLLMWQSIFSEEAGTVRLHDLDTGQTTVIGSGRTLQAVWRDDSTRLAFSAGDETFVHDLTADQTMSAGSADAVDCGPDDFVTWGRVPLTFAPNGDLYVGDPVCTSTTEGFPTVEYRLRQLILS